MTIKNSFAFACSLLISSAFAQTSISNKINTAFDKDSIRGFNEQNAVQSTLAMHLSDYEYRVRLYQLKRIYINNKYALWPVEKNNDLPVLAKAETISSCFNTDFEQGNSGNTYQLAGNWVLTRGYNDPTTYTNATTCNLLGCCGNTGQASQLYQVASTDYNIGSAYPIYSVFGSGSPNTTAAAINTQLSVNMFGNSYFRLNDISAGDYSIEKLSKTFSVTSANSLFQFAYIAVIGAAHNCCDAAAFQYKLTNVTTSNTVVCLSGAFITPPTLPDGNGDGNCVANAEDPEFYLAGIPDSVYAPAPNPPWPLYNKWKLVAFDLSPYIGQTITVDFIASDCDLGAHFGYAYLDAYCGPMQLVINGNNAAFNNSNTLSISACEPTSTVSAPSGFPSYQWNGPSGFSSTAQTITTSVSGTYTLTLGETNQCSTTKIIHIDNLSVSSSDSLLCSGSQATLTATGLNGYLWNTGETSASIVVSPTAPGSFMVSGTTINGYACTASLVQNVVTCTGITGLSAQQHIIIYPNPNSGEFMLRSAQELKAELTLENIVGQVVYSQSVQQGENKIKTKDLVPGIYYYTVIENRMTVTRGKIEIRE